MAEQTSRLSIVINSKTAEGQLKALRQNLREVQKYGDDMNKSLSKIGSKTQFAGLAASLKSVQSTLQAFSGTAKNSASALEAFNVAAKNLSTTTKSIATNLNTSQAAMARFATSSKSISGSLQSTGTSIAQTQASLMKIIGSFNFASNASSKLSVSAKALKTDLASLNASLATGSGALGRFGQASGAAGAASSAAKARNTELANSYRLINTGLQSNAQFLQQANRAMAANSKEAVAAKLIQDRLAISTSKAAMAASNAAAASTRAQIAIVNLAAASSKASAALSGAGAAASKAAGAMSNAAAAATRAAGATVNLGAASSRAAAASSGAALAALRLSTAEARAAADADRLAGALSRTNTQGRSLMGTLTGLQGALMGGLFSIATLGVLKTADAMQSLNSRVKLVTDSSAEYLAVQGRLRAMAQSNLTQYDSLITLYASSRRALKQLGKTQNETLGFTENITKAMFIGGGAAASQAAALVQLGQALNSGFLRGEEFNSIAEQAPILLELVAEKMGVAQGALRKLAADGKISSRILYDAISEATQKLSDMAAKMPATMTQGLETVKNQWKFFIDDMLNSTGGFSSIMASSLIGLGNNLSSLIPILVAAGLAWGAYALATSAAVTTGIASAISGMAGMGGWLLFNSMLIKAQILSFSGLSAVMSGYAGMVAAAALVLKAKATAMAQSLAITVLSTAAIIRNGDVIFTLTAAARGAATAIAQKVAAMRSGISIASLYTAALSGVAGVAGVAAASVKGLGVAVARLGGIINAHPIIFLAATLISVVAATEDAEGKTRGFAGAMDSLSEAVKVVGSLFLDFVKFTIDGITSIGSVFGAFITSFVQNSESGANQSSNMFAVFFSNTEGGFVGLLQVFSRFSDLAAASIRNLIKSVVRGMGNLTKDVANKAGMMGNVLVDAFEWAAGGIAKALNFISGGVGWAVKQLNKISPIQISVEERDYVAPKLDRFIADRKLDIQGWSESMMPIMEDQMVNGLSGTVQRAIDSTRIAAQEAKADLDLVADGIANIDGADGKGKKKKAAKEKKPKVLKDKEAENYLKLIEAYEQQLASFDREIYDTMATFNTELRKIGYEVDDVTGKFYELPEAFKDNLRKAAKALDDQKMFATVRDTLNGFERQLALIGKDSAFEQWSYDLNDASNILSTMTDDMKSMVLEQADLLDKTKLTHEANKSIEDSIGGINKEIALMSTSGSALDEFIYDLNNTEKYANASGDAISNLGDAITKLENIKNKDALKGVLNRIEGTTPESEIEAQYQSDMDALNNANLIELGLLETHKEAKLAIDKSYQDAKRDLELQKQANTVSSLTAMFGLALGETSKGYRGMFAIQQAYDFVQAQSASFTAIAKAWGSAPFPANLPAVATTTLSTGIIPAAISALSPKGFKTGGYTGNMGVNDVAGQVHGQEYVFDAQATKRIGVNNLNAMRSGRAANDDSKVNVNIINNSSAKVTASDDGQTITISDVRREAKKAANGAFSELNNPNSHSSKMVNRNTQAARRR